MKKPSAIPLVLAIALLLPAISKADIVGDVGASVVAPSPAPEPEPLVEVSAPAPTPVVVVAPQPAPTVVVPPQTATVAVPESQVYGPTPEESADPKRLLHVFCQAWKDENWKRVWYCMDPAFRKKSTFAAFKRRFEDDAEMTGGLDDETIAPNPKKVQGTRQTFEVTLNFQNAPLAKPRKVLATLKTTPEGYRIVDSTILPADLDDM